VASIWHLRSGDHHDENSATMKKYDSIVKLSRFASAFIRYFTCFTYYIPHAHDRPPICNFRSSKNSRDALDVDPLFGAFWSSFGASAIGYADGLRMPVLRQQAYCSRSKHPLNHEEYSRSPNLCRNEAALNLRASPQVSLERLTRALETRDLACGFERHRTARHLHDNWRRASANGRPCMALPPCAPEVDQ